MARKSIVSKIASWLRGKKPPKVSATLKAPRGISAESVPGRLQGRRAEEFREQDFDFENPDATLDEALLNEGDFTEQEKQQWEYIPTSEVTEFLLLGRPMWVASSNVVGIQFLRDENKMIVEFGARTGGKRFYEYSNVSMDEARAFAFAPSKGVFVWNTFRQRGTVRGHKKPYKPCGGYRGYEGAGQAPNIHQ